MVAREAKGGGGAAEEVFVISVAAQLSGMHAQTLRTYDRLGLVCPVRTRGGVRRYTRADIEALHTIQRLSQRDGVNLAGIKEILKLTRRNAKLAAELAEARREVAELTDRVAALKARSLRSRGEIVHVPRSTAIVMWDPSRRSRFTSAGRG